MPEIFRSVTQGDSSDVMSVYPKSSLSPVVMDGNWECMTAVVDCSNNIVVASRDAPTKNGDNTQFLVALTSAETALLETELPYRDYYWVFQLKNDALTRPYNVEKRIKLRVFPEGIS